MSNQKTETIENTNTTSDLGDSSLSSTSNRSSDPPSWSALLNKLKRNMNISSFSSKTIGYISAMLLLGFGTSLLPFLAFSIPGGWLTTAFLITMFSGVLGRSDYIASGIAGGTVAGVVTLFSTAFLMFPVFAALGAAAGMAGMAIGNQISSD